MRAPVLSSARQFEYLQVRIIALLLLLGGEMRASLGVY